MAKSDLKSAAAGSGSKRKPKLGQNFLTDHSAAKRIVEALGDISNRTVIEIGRPSIRASVLVGHCFLGKTNMIGR